MPLIASVALPGSPSMARPGRHGPFPRSVPDVDRGLAGVLRSTARDPDRRKRRLHMSTCRGSGSVGGDVHGRDAQVAAARDSSPHAAEGVGGGDGRLALAPRSLAENCVRRDSPSLQPSDRSTCFPGRGAGFGQASGASVCGAGRSHPFPLHSSWEKLLRRRLARFIKKQLPEAGLMSRRVRGSHVNALEAPRCCRDTQWRMARWHLCAARIML